MSTVSYLTLAFAVILLGLRLPSFLDRLGVSKAEKFAIITFMFMLLIGVAVATPNLFSPLTSIFR